MNWNKLFCAFLFCLGITFICDGVLLDYTSMETGGVLGGFFNWKSWILDAIGIFCILGAIDVLTKKIIGRDNEEGIYKEGKGRV